MEKILVVLNPGMINMNVVDFACYLAGLTGSELTAILLEKPAQDPAMQEKVFDACRKKGVRMRVRHDSGDAVSATIAETRFADMLVLDPECSFEDKRQSVPSDFTRAVLAGSECPVVIAPYTFNGIEEVLFAYDGCASSTFAMKQFTYLFPELSDLKLTIIQVSEEAHMPLIEQQKLIEFLQMHYSFIGFRILEGKADEELHKFLQDKKNIIVVMGAFGRNKLSAIIKPSTADLLLKTVDLPLFIAH